jgi:cytochrome c peroxidase
MSRTFSIDDLDKPLVDVYQSPSDESPKSSRRAILVAGVALAVLVVSQIWLTSQYVDPPSPSGGAAATDKPAAFAGSARILEPIQPLTPVNFDVHAAAIGEKLFHDERLSGDETISCASCHQLKSGGDDGVPLSRGVGGRLGSVNAPTVLNAALHFRLFWDGRAATLEEQVDGPLLDEREMASTWAHVLEVIRYDREYRGLFAAVYDGEISQRTVRSSIAEFERSLVTVGGRFDRWLMGDDDAISPEELRGYELFKEYQCVSCHQGAAVGGNMYQRLGVMREYFALRRQELPSDLGRFNQTGDERDRYALKVPSLRNVAETAPYFHDGSTATLEEAVRAMIEYQLGKTVVESDVKRIVAFLRTLSGDGDK